MKKIVFFVLLSAVVFNAHAQNVSVAEPEFVNSYCILTSDSTYATLPKEQGTIGKHQNKVKKWSKLLGGAATIVGAAGAVGAHAAAHSGSLSGVMTGVTAVNAASGVGTAADVVSGLAGSSGMDVIFRGGKSSYVVKSEGQTIRLLIKGEKNDADPMDSYRLVRFNASKKERRIQWMEFESSLIGSEETKKAGYVPFEGHKYGEQSYLLTIPASEAIKGEYGVFFMNIITATYIPVGTFSIQ